MNNYRLGILDTINGCHLFVDHKVTDTSSKLYEDLGLDSVDIVDLAMFIENRHDIRIPEDVIYTWDTIEEIIQYVVENTPNE